MVKSCAAYKCKARYSKESGISFHVFPKDIEWRDKWVNAMKRQNFKPSSSSVLCSQHFEPSCYNNKFGQIKLLSSAIPTIFDFPNHLQKIQNVRKTLKRAHEPVTQDKVEPSKRRPQNRKVYLRDYSEDDFVDPNVAKNAWKSAIIKLSEQNIKRKTLQSKNRRLTKKVQCLTSLLKRLEKKCFLNANLSSVLKESLPLLSQQLLVTSLKGRPFKKFPPELRSFALTLLFYSTKAYDYVRKTLFKQLPHRSTLRKWHVDEAMNGDAVLKRILIPSIQPGVCFICGGVEKLRSLLEQQNVGGLDDYRGMFSACYNLEIIDKGRCAEMCQACVGRLEDALLFRKQVEAVNQRRQQETLFDDTLPQDDLPLQDEISNDVVEWPECDKTSDVSDLKSSQVFDMLKQADESESTQPHNFNVSDVLMSQCDAPSPIDSFIQAVEFPWQDETADTGSSAQHSSREVGEIFEITNLAELLGENWQKETPNDNFRKDRNLLSKASLNGIEEEYDEILPGAVYPHQNMETLENCNNADQHTDYVLLQCEEIPTESDEIIVLSSQKIYSKPNEQQTTQKTGRGLENIESNPQIKNITRNEKIKLTPMYFARLNIEKDTVAVENPNAEAINCIKIEGSGKRNNENLVSARGIPRLPKFATSCPICDLEETSRAKLSKHYHTKHFPNFVCNVCGKVFRRMANYKSHLSSHDADNLICKLCDKSYSKKAYLEEHIQVYHMNKKTYCCTKCSEEFSGSPARSKHMFKVHGIPYRQYACADCGKVFYTVQHHNIHVKRAHFNLREHGCTQCNLTFYTNFELKRHMVTHSDERNHICEKCRKMFRLQRVLTLHQKTHCHLK